MNAKLTRTIIIVFLIVVLIALSVGLIAVCIHSGFKDAFLKFIDSASIGTRALLMCTSVLLILLSAFLLFVPAFEKKVPDLSLKTLENGEVSIKSSALEKLAELSIDNVQGVKGKKIHVDTKDMMLVYHVQLTVSDNVKIPEVVDKVQRRISTYVSDRIGTAVNNVDVQVVSCSRDDSKPVVTRVR